jgi:hypothetical protein
LLGRQAYPGPSATPSAETEGYPVTSPNEKDIGEQQILKRVEEYKPFTISIYSPFTGHPMLRSSAGANKMMSWSLQGLP